VQRRTLRDPLGDIELLAHAHVDVAIADDGAQITARHVFGHDGEVASLCAHAHQQQDAGMTQRPAHTTRTRTFSERHSTALDSSNKKCPKLEADANRMISASRWRASSSVLLSFWLRSILIATGEPRQHP
jgi:hypothetical protein